ncbi:MAG: response regulator transcription factor [Thermoanaerobaculia bacterium]
MFAAENSVAALLLIDQDELHATAVSSHLERDGYAVSWFRDPGPALRAVRGGRWDAAIVDLATTGGDGAALCHELRHDPKTRDLAIVALSDGSGTTAAVAALESGADDAMTKPISLWELSARIAAVLRRRDDPASFHHDYGRLTIDARSRSVTVDALDVKLGRKEFELLVFLARNAHGVLTRAEILNGVWGLPGDSETRTLDAHVKNLRRKIGREWITTVVGLGYRFDPDAAAGGRAGSS